VLLVSLLAVAYYEYSSVEHRLQDLTNVDPYDWDSMGSGRILIWRSALDDLAQSSLPDILIGRGSAKIYDATGGFGGHSDLVDLLYRHGIIGLLAYCFFLGALVRATSRSVRLKSIPPPAGSAALAAVAAYVACALTNGMLYGITTMGFFSWTVGGIIGLAAAEPNS